MNSQSKDPLDLSVVDLKNPEERRQFLEALIKEGSERARQAVAELKAKGLIDADGKRVSNELPEDMRPDSPTDVGG